MRLLLHVCCGPCAAGAMPFWQPRVREIVGFFFNPNIHPLLEYRRRLTGARELGAALDVKMAVDEVYDPQSWFSAVATGEPGRCGRCISLRLDRAAREALEQGCDCFSTTLTISPWQDHEAIRESGSAAARTHGVEFLYEDLRPHYRESRRRTKELGIYRQQYCGCLISEWERYRDLRP
jgi:predicted adenine nucleotide alpha hydrolase (AANH) superfamily ATPase